MFQKFFVGTTPIISILFQATFSHLGGSQCAQPQRYKQCWNQGWYFLHTCPNKQTNKFKKLNQKPEKRNTKARKKHQKYAGDYCKKLICDKKVITQEENTLKKLVFSGEDDCSS